MSLVPVTAVMILSARLLAQSAEPPQEKTAQHPPPQLCVVSGSVVTAAEGTPLKSARVALISEGHNSKKHMYAASTDSDGRFLLKDVEQGRYTFLATRAGFVDQHYQAKGAETGATLALKPGDKVSDVLFRMTLAAVITGRVTSEDGEAMVRIQVVALRAPNDEEMEDEELPISKKQKLVAVFSTLTDDRGQYRIFGLKPGEYFIQVTDSLQPDPVGGWEESYQVQEFLGSEYASAYYPGVSQAGQAQSISVKAGAEAQADVPCAASRPRRWQGTS